MDEVKKIEHYKNLNTRHIKILLRFRRFKEKNKKNKEMSEIVAGSILQIITSGVRIANSLRLGRMGKWSLYW